MYPSRHGEHEHGAHGRCHGYGHELRLDDIEVEHDGHSWRHEEETDVAYEKLRQAAHPLQAYDAELEQQREYEHAEDARRKGHVGEVYDELSQCEAAKEYGQLTYYHISVKEYSA